MAGGRITDADIYTGRRIRTLRLAAGLSQTEVGDALGITFQQIQKYENGTNRVSSGRLTELAKFLDLPVTAFFKNGHDQRVPDVDTMLRTNNGIRLARAFSKINDSEMQLRIVRLVEAMTKE
jgi:transcriptional regulator with XRE-family HTH domain